jgi:hypothetical protein
MTLLTKQGASIAGRILRLLSRKPVSIPVPRNDPTLGRTYPFRLTQNSEAEITAELAPKACNHDAAAALSLGDMVRAATISGFSTKPLPKFELVQGTGNHKGSAASCKEFGYARIDTPLRNVLEKKPKASPSPPKLGSPSS